MTAILIVRLGALGDIVHALPAVAALRRTFPSARIDWVVSPPHHELLALMPVVNRVLVLDSARGGLKRMLSAIATLRGGRYDAAVDLQGLMKSAVLARSSGARRVIGFGIWHLRERGARPFYTETARPDDGRHVIDKNLALVESLGVVPGPYEFPLSRAGRDAAAILADAALPGDVPFAVVNAGAAWPNKRWPPERFGELARRMRERFGLHALVIWGPGERDLAASVVAHSAGSAVTAPATTVADLIALADAASLMISGDTGPLHLFAARKTPIVGIYGPTNPTRNGPWSNDDVTVSRFAFCKCHHKRKCHAEHWCLDDVSVEDVYAAVGRRLALAGRPLGTTPVASGPASGNARDTR
jgi:lipopolysaccharide heptosyltransferase I